MLLLYSKHLTPVCSSLGSQLHILPPSHVEARAWKVGAWPPTTCLASELEAETSRVRRAHDAIDEHSGLLSEHLPQLQAPQFLDDLTSQELGQTGN